MTTHTWSPEEDAILLRRRQPPSGRPIPWKAAAPIGAHSKRDCQRRLKVLTGEVAVPEVKAAAQEVQIDRDGLDWLRRKRRLDDRQLAAGLHYRDVSGRAENEGALIKSGLDVVEGKGSGGIWFEGRILGRCEATTRLHFIRGRLFRGQPDVLTVLDGVCARGRTLRDLAGGSWSRAGELEAVLKVALDLLASDLDTVRAAA